MRAGVTVSLHDGRAATIEVSKPLGSPENPLNIAKMQDKFVDCARNAVHPLPEDAVAQVMKNILDLERIKDVKVLLAGFV